jgi:hypothetical protein
MLKATVYIQRKNSKGVEDDDVIRFSEDDEFAEMVAITYSSPEMKKDNTFYLPRSRAMTYLDEVLKSLSHDSDPFEYVQVTTAMHPSVLYHVSDLDCRDIRYLIEDTVESAIARPIHRNKKH